MSTTENSLTPTELYVSLTAAHIRAAQHGPYDNPVALALNSALEGAGFFRLGDAMICVERGSGLTPILDARAAASSYEANTTWNARLFGYDVPLPKHCQMLLWVFSYGCTSGPYAERDEAGSIIARRTYQQIVKPIDFSLAFLAPRPNHRTEAKHRTEEQRMEEQDRLEFGELQYR